MLSRKITSLHFHPFMHRVAGVGIAMRTETRASTLISEEIDFFVLASLAMKLREYTRNTPIRRNPVSKFSKKIF